jgi:hypothetical protein
VETTSEPEELFPNPIQPSTNFQKIVTKLNRPLTITLEQGAILVLSLTGILTRFVGLGNRVMSHDESLHVYYSWLLSTGKGFVHTPMMHGPFLFESTALMNLFFGANDFSEVQPTWRVYDQLGQLDTGRANSACPWNFR